MIDWIIQASYWLGSLAAFLAITIVFAFFAFVVCGPRDTADDDEAWPNE